MKPQDLHFRIQREIPVRMVPVSSSKTKTVPNLCKNSVPNLTPALVGRWRSKLHRRDQRVPCEAWQPRRPLRDVSSCRRFFLPPLGPLAVPSSSFFWTTHLVLGTRRRRRFKPPPRCFGHSSVVVVERHAPALDNAPAMIDAPLLVGVTPSCPLPRRSLT